MLKITRQLGFVFKDMEPAKSSSILRKSSDIRKPIRRVAVDEHARVTIEKVASKLYEASPWAADKRAAEIVRPAPVQTADRVPPKSLARDIAFAKLQSRILSAAGDMLPEQQAIVLSAGGPGTGTCWTAMHKSPTEPAQNAQWRMATALRLAATADAGPRSTCALRKGNDGNMREQPLAAHPFHSFCCKYGGARNRPHRAVQCALHRLIVQAGGCADMERHVPELHDWLRNKDDAAPVRRCAILDVVSWFPGVLQQLWIDVSVRCPHAERYNESAGVAAAAGKAEKTKRYVMAVRALVFETYGRLGIEGTKLLRDLVTTAAANGQCSPHVVGQTQLERVLLTAQAGTYLRALGSRVAERPAAESPLLLAEQSVHSFVCLDLLFVRLSCEGSSDRDTRHRHSHSHSHSHSYSHSHGHRHRNRDRHRHRDRDKDRDRDRD